MFLAHLKTATKPATATARDSSPAVPVNRIQEPEPVRPAETKPPAVSPVSIVETRNDSGTVSDIARGPAVPSVANVPAVPAVRPVPVVYVKPNQPQPPAEPFSEYPDGTRFESIETLQPLRGSGRSGDFVHNSQVMDERFRNVSTGWTKRANNPDDTRVMTWDDALAHVERERGQTRDIIQTYGRLSVVSDSAGLGLLDERGNRLQFTSNSLDQFADKIGIGVTLPRVLIAGDELDRKTLATVIQNGLRKVSEKTALIRLRNDGTARAFLSDSYTILDNRWFLEVLRRLIPDGLVSHFRGIDNCDSVFFNVLIPDSMRAETDSEYGGMLACGNGETGERKLSTCPSVFRAICMNGCIWDELQGTGIIKKVHRGEINLNELAGLIRENLNRQIPLLSNGIDSMLKTRAIVSDVSAVPAIGSVLRSLSIPGITRVAADSVLTAYNEQRTEPARVSAFDILQGITSAAQTFPPALQETAERAAGSAMLWERVRWENVLQAARTITSGELNRVFATVS